MTSCSHWECCNCGERITEYNNWIEIQSRKYPSNKVPNFPFDEDTFYERVEGPIRYILGISPNGRIHREGASVMAMGCRNCFEKVTLRKSIYMFGSFEIRNIPHDYEYETPEFVHDETMEWYENFPVPSIKLNYTALDKVIMKLGFIDSTKPYRG